MNIGGAISGGAGAATSSVASSGSSLLNNLLIKNGADNLIDTAVGAVEDISHGRDVTLGSLATDFTVGMVASGGSAKKPSGSNNVVSSGTTNVTDKLGGAYKDVPANADQRHHMPADSVSNYSKTEDPVIRMETADHMDTNSWRSSAEAQAYRKQQEELINKGDFKSVQQMDIDDAKKKFPGKYDEAIKQMEEYTNEILKK